MALTPGSIYMWQMMAERKEKEQEDYFMDKASDDEVEVNRAPVKRRVTEVKMRSWNTRDLQETLKMQPKIQVREGDSRVSKLMALLDTKTTKSVIGKQLADQLEVEVTKPKRRYEVTNASNDSM